MSVIRKDFVFAAIQREFHLVDTSVHNNIHKYFEFRKQTVLADESLTKDEKSEAVKILNRDYCRDKLLNNDGEKRI